MSYDDYLNRIKNNALARQIKLAALHHNSDLTRLRKIKELDLLRVENIKNPLPFLVNNYFNTKNSFYL